MEKKKQQASIKITLDEEQLTDLIKCSLCSAKDQAWTYISDTAQIALHVKGNVYNVQKKIFEWLGVPARVDNFNMLSTKDIDLSGLSSIVFGYYHIMFSKEQLRRAKIKGDLIQIRIAGDHAHKAFFLDTTFYDWRLEKDDSDVLCLIPTVKGVH